MDISTCASRCRSLSSAEKVLFPHLLHILLFIIILLGSINSAEVTGTTSTLMTGLKKEVPSPNLQTAHEVNEECHDPNVLKYRKIRIMAVSLLSTLVKNTQ